jgi:hypothetical protein
MVNARDQAKVQTDASGQAFVMVNGEKRKVLINERGQQYFVKADGKIEIINQFDEDEESEEEENLLDENGCCKTCK